MIKTDPPEDRPGDAVRVSIGEAFKAARKEAGINQWEVAEQGHVDETMVRMVENGGKYSLKIRAKVLDGLNKMRLLQGWWARLVVSEHDGMPRLVAAPPTWLEFPDRVWLSRFHGPGALLTADYALVPFHGVKSKSELNGLMNWCKSGDQFGIRIYKGEGGVGKTRLAIELCRGLARENWSCGFSAVTNFPEESIPWRTLPDLQKPLLVVVDYAAEEKKRHLVLKLLLSLKECPTPKVRLLLLERDDIWLDELHAERAAREILLGPLLSPAGQEWVHLAPPVASSFAERVDSFRRATKAFSKKLGLPSPGEPVVDLMQPLFARVLFIHIQALLSVIRARSTPNTKESILRHLLSREREYWKKRLEPLGLSVGLVPGIEQAVWQISFNNGVSDAESAAKLLEKVPLLGDQPELTRLQILRLLRQCYPQGDAGIGPLQPDELKDYLISRSF